MIACGAVRASPSLAAHATLEQGLGTGIGIGIRIGSSHPEGWLGIGLGIGIGLTVATLKAANEVFLSAGRAISFSQRSSRLICTPPPRC